MPAKEPKLDFTRLSFPTDRLTVLDMRKVAPDFFGPDNVELLDKGWQRNVSPMLFMERLLAHKAFAAALGLPDPEPDSDWSRRELIRMLTDDYKRFGLASGRKHTEELVRSIEAAAVEQARAYLGPRRG